MLTPDWVFSIAFSCKIHCSAEQEARLFATHQRTSAPRAEISDVDDFVNVRYRSPKVSKRANYLNLEQLNQEKGSGRDFCGTARWLTRRT
jgi:hypothetical protein